MTTLLGEARVRIRPDTLGFLNDASRDLSKSGTALGGVFSKAMRAGALAVGGITVAAGVAAKATYDIGVGYQNSLNTLKAVSSATASQMAAVGKTAKALGSDMSLPATSAADAATAMTELAKGGLTVEQSMSAAKGTLQLAAAAQIDAGKAAEYQSNTLNAFSLNADQASRVADVLANTANAASGEITDFGDAFAQASAVAASTGISLEDTAATLGVLANNGIKGSDAGTLLKSALLALQSPSVPATKAMDALSLSAYDASGNFVGLSSVFGQLQAAQKSMTPEAYAAATSTLFGSDAARLAGIAGKEGAAGFDTMRDAMGRQGAAADVAAAKSAGVGGAVEALKSQVETFQIDLFERAAPNIEKLVRFAATEFPKVGDAIFNGIETGIQVFDDVKDKGVDAFQAVSEYLAPVTSQLDNFWASLTAAHGPADIFFGSLKTGAGIVIDVATALHPLVTVGGGLLDLFTKLPGPIQTVVLGLAALKTASAFDLFGKLSGRDGVTGSVASSMQSAGTSISGFAQTAKVNMRLAGDEVGAFSKVAGGLSASFQTYFPEATAAVTNFKDAVGSAFDQAKKAQQVQTATTFGIDPEQIASSVGDLAGLRAAARAAATEGIGHLRAGITGLVNTMGAFNIVMLATTALVGALSSAHSKGAAQIDSWGQSLLDGGDAAAKANAEMQHTADVTKTGLGGIHSWGDAWDRVTALTQGTTDSQKKAADAAKKTYEALSPLGRAQQDVTRYTNDLTYAVEKYGDNSPQALAASQNLAGASSDLAVQQNKVAEAAKTATQRLHEQANVHLLSTNADIAASQANTTLQQTMAETAATMADGTKSALEQTSATDQLSQAAIDAANAAAAQASAHSAARTEEGKAKDADAALLASLQATAQQLGTATPAAITQLIASLSATSTEGAQTAAAMGDLGIQVKGIPDSKSVIIDAPTAKQAQDIYDLGYNVEHLPDGTVKVTADTSSAERTIAGFLGQQRTLSLNVAAGAGTSGGGGTNKHLATGGAVFGPGTATSDSIATYLSNGEFVIKAASVAKYGYGLMDAINAGRFADGGLVGATRTREPALVGSSTPTTVNHAPIIGGNLVLQVAPGASVTDQMEEAMFQLRRMRRGGRHA